MKEILRKAAKFKALSDEYHTRYDGTRDPSVIAEFHKNSFLAMKESWVQNEIIKWYLQHDFESIKALGLSKGEKKDQNRYIMAVKRLMIFDKVNDLVSKGSTKTEAFRTIGKNFLGAKCSADAIRNAYYAGAKFEPEMRIEETEIETITICGPTRVWIPSLPHFYGFWEIRQPKK
jgi:hypothetical protein